MLFGFGKSRRVIGIGLDGMPLSLAMKFIEEGVMPNLGRLAAEGEAREIHSVLPTVSNVAWCSFQTGVNPGEFGIFGFVELEDDLSLRIPSANDIRCPTLWQKLDNAKKSYAALSIPQSWPAHKTKNTIVSGFLAPTLDDRATSNPECLSRLKELGYEIDIDPAVAIGEPERFKRDLMRVARARRKTALSLLHEKKWDLFFVHVMDTDRLHHFMWDAVHEPETDNGRFFREFYGEVDEFIGQIMAQAGKDYGVLICSDHGFTDLKWGVQLNRWLREEGFLEYENDPTKAFQAVKPCSKALSLVPGRIHILREGHWRRGIVTDADYESVRTELLDRLRALRHPETGDVVCKQVLRGEEIFTGPQCHRAPDIVIDPTNGFDLQARLGTGHIFDTGPRTGMHTLDDAMLFVSEKLVEPFAGARTITDVGRLMGEYLL